MQVGHVSVCQSASGDRVCLVVVCAVVLSLPVRDRTTGKQKCELCVFVCGVTRCRLSLRFRRKNLPACTFMSAFMNRLNADTESSDVCFHTAEKNGLSFIETSALDSTNVETAFQNILTGEWKC